jgi:hypothetical protein
LDPNPIPKHPNELFIQRIITKNLEDIEEIEAAYLDDEDVLP